MKKPRILLLVVMNFFFLFSLIAQELKISQESSTELTKTSKSGRYAGTYLKDGKLRVLYLTSSKDDGVQLEQYDFDQSLNFNEVSDRFVTPDDATNEFVWYMPWSKVQKVAPDSQKFLQAAAAFGGGMKIKLGYMQKNYYLNIYKEMSFVEEKALKPKTGDIWRIQPSGYKSTSKIGALSTDAGFYKNLKKYGNPLIAPANSPLLAAGVITEKVKMKGPWTSSSNRVVILALDGNNFDASKYNIYPLPYSAMNLGSGLGQDDNLCSLFAPLNAPTTVSSLKHFLWKDRKNHFTLMRFSDNYELVDSVTFISDLQWGIFNVFNSQESTFITGLGKASFEGWARNAYGITLKKVEDIQITKIKDGALVYSKVYSVDELEDKMVVPNGEKVKNNFAPPHKEYFKEIISLANGDALALAQSGYGTYALQISPTGDLKAYYRIPRVDDKAESTPYNYQIVINGDNLYLVLNEQPFEFTNNAQIETSTTDYGNITSTRTTITKLNEVFLQSHLVKINTQSMTMSNRLVMDGKDFYTIGSYPAILKENAIYFTGRDKGPKGKKVFVVRVDL